MNHATNELLGLPGEAAIAREAVAVSEGVQRIRRTASRTVVFVNGKRGRSRRAAIQPSKHRLAAIVDIDDVLRKVAHRAPRSAFASQEVMQGQATRVVVPR